MGEVYLAEDTRLDRKVALKLLPPGLAADLQAKKRFIREAKSAATLEHPNICAIYEVGEDNGQSFIAMQLVDGETLASRLGRGPIGLAESMEVGLQTADALLTAHSRGIIHRDIKPQNIMITDRGQVKVLDFGLAKRVDEGTTDIGKAETASMLTEAGLIIGTVPYMSPEQVRGERLDSRSDIFSFGVVLYEMLTGQRPFVAKSTAELISAILTSEPAPLQNQSGPLPSRLDLMVRKCLAKEPGDRYQTMDELQAEMIAIRRDWESGQLATTPSEATTQVVKFPTAGKTSRPWFTRSRLMVAFVAVFILSALAYLMFSRNPATGSAPALNRSSPAYDYYLRGKVNVTKQNSQDNASAIKLLEQAVNADPDFAPAWAELAWAYNVKSFYLTSSEAEKKQLNEDAEVAVEKALALDRTLAEGYAARGFVLWSPANRFPHERAIQSYKQALTLNPQLDEAHHELGVVYFHIGLLEKAWAEIEKALEIRPSNNRARFRLGVIKIYQAQYAEALALFKSIPREINPSLVDRNVATALFKLGKIAEASAVIEEYLKTNPEDEGGNITSVKAMILAQSGKKREAEETIKRAIEIGRSFGHFHHTAYNIGSAYALMNMPEEAVKWLNEAADDGFPCYPWFENDASLNNLRNDERFKAFMAERRKQWEEWKKTL